jgi:GTPase SAR1 family protein
MSVEKLHDYIAEFREWLAAHGEPSLQSQQASLVADWREELSAAERLLEAKPELPIAFLGPAQQGKSSLINALLGENILAVGGAVGACTCVITSAHYRSGPHYRAEIDFISLRDWHAELVAMQEALASSPSADDTDLDREEREAAQKTAHEKFKAVYREESSDDLGHVLSDARLGLPKEIAEAMSSGKPIVVEEEKAITLRNKVRRYLVGREQHEDGQFWPLISRVRIYGEFEVLSNGVVLVDLPGLNDPNPAREQVTKKYLEEARYIWLVCDSQKGIDRVFTQVLRDNGFFFRLFLEGRLGAFSVVATRVDDINIEAILTQMGIELEDYDGNYAGPLDFRRQEIAAHIQRNLLAIAEDIVARADGSEHREAFLQRVRAVPVFSISTAAYLHAEGRMKLYQGMQLAPEDTHVPRLIEHLHSITLEESYASQIEASCRRLQMLHERVRRFFLDLIRRVEQDSAEARREWQTLGEVAEQAISEGETALQHVRIRFEESLDQHCLAFEERLADLDARAALALKAIFTSWEGIHWRSLQAAVKREGEWFSRATGRDINFNRDVARAYLDLLPFIWEDFFGTHLSKLIEEVASGTEAELQKTAARLKGALDMLHQQPDGIRESMEASLRAAGESFQLQSGQVGAALTAQIQRTRQSLSGGMVATASSFMGPAYAEAGNDPGGTGIKRRMLDTLARYAEQHAPSLFINMRQELTEGVTVLQTSMKPQLSKIVGYGEGILDHFRQNMGGHQIVTPELREKLRDAVDCLPSLTHSE